VDPISLIVAALTAGAAAALKDTAGSAVKDAYAGLKTLLRRRFAGDHDAEAALAHAEREPEGDLAPLKQQLLAAGADRDDALVKAARALLEQADPEGAKAGKYNVTVTGGQGVVIGDAANVTMNFPGGG
jgi:hypothetical protein